MIRAAVVDVDDTLCQTEAACYALENEVLTRIGRAPMPRAIHLSTWGMTLLEAMPLRSPGIDLDHFSAVYPEVLNTYVTSGQLDIISPETLRTLDDLILSGRQLMLLTSRTEPEVRHLLAPDHPLTTRLTATYHADNTRFQKPDPRAFDEFLAASGYRPDECVYIGDSPADAAAATGAGLRFIACLESGVRHRDDFSAYPVDVFVQSFHEIATVVDHLSYGSRPDPAPHPQPQAHSIRSGAN
ncbi:HAD family hydrolase [Nonomuraea sp. NPDC050663]|uniref:HAD family hydrolase n=1 Tax=Nonomuraea sp. NPDC050663 TaxID=3364370 RepID=UPI00378AA74A